MSKTKQSPYGPKYGFAINKPRQKPPIEVDPREWSRRTQTDGYIKRIAKSVRQVDTYLILVRGYMRGLSGHQRDACHYFADVSTFDSERRNRASNSIVAPGKDILGDSLKY